MPDWLATLVSWYSDPLFLLFPVAALALGMGTFVLVGGAWTLLAWWDPEWARPYRIQPRPFNIRRQLRETLSRMGFNTAVLTLLLVLTWPLLRLSGIHAGAVPPWYVFVGQLIFFVLLDDFLYYWMHRWMHENKWLLRHVHAVHHQIRQPYGLAGNHFHWLEFVMTVGLAMVGPILVGAHVYVVWAWFILRQWEAVDGHTGYNLPWDPFHWLPLYEGAGYHDFHHARFKGNFAGFLPLWDRVFGTYVPDYLKWRQEQGHRPGLVPGPESRSVVGRRTSDV
ncbi:sterol desaturase family protein [Marinobacteraceae bacterium S3BR75-40.1]